MVKVLLIIPAYNEETNILNTVKQIKDYKKYQLDYVIINDGSTDDTKKICVENNLNFIDLINNLGIGGAVQTGYKYAHNNHYDIAIQFDGDGQHDINYVDRLIEPIIADKYDMIIGSRFVADESQFKSTLARQFGINILSFFIKILSGKKIKDVTSGYRAANKKVIKLFSQKYPTDYPEPETIVELAKLGYRIKEVGVNMREREGGESSIKSLKSAYYMIKVSIALLVTSISIQKRSGKNGN